MNAAISRTFASWLLLAALGAAACKDEGYRAVERLMTGRESVATLEKALGAPILQSDTKAICETGYRCPSHPPKNRQTLKVFRYSTEYLVAVYVEGDRIVEYEILGS